MERLIPPRDTPVPLVRAVEGKYANYLGVGHNAFEVVLDFAQVFSDDALATPHTRIITSPPYAKEMLAVLQQAINDYEQAFGPIPDATEPPA